MKACSKLGKLSVVEVRIVLAELYEREYGIYEPDPGTLRPLSSVALHPAENFIDNSMLEESMTLFARDKLYETFGISHAELLKLPRHMVGLYHKVAAKQAKAMSERADALQSEVSRETEKANAAARANAIANPAGKKRRRYAMYASLTTTGFYGRGSEGVLSVIAQKAWSAQ